MTKPGRREDVKRQTEARRFVLKARFDDLDHPGKPNLDVDLSGDLNISTDYTSAAGASV